MTVWTERVLLDMLRDRHTRQRPGNGPKWAYMEHVRDDAGFFAGTTIDALALHLWPSSHHQLHAFEVKISRPDWRRELANPAKSAPWLASADCFWIVAPQGVVDRGELPRGWGLLEARGDHLTAVRSAQTLHPLVTLRHRLGSEGPGLPDLRRGLVAAMLRSAIRTANPKET